MKTDKIRPHHLERKAMLYVRQSSAHQVLHNRESSALQYAMRDRLTELGWSQIETVDDDLGRSAAGGVARAGFERMVAEVCLGKVGAVAAREVSRFARNSRDWQQLIEIEPGVRVRSRRKTRSEWLALIPGLGAGGGDPQDGERQHPNEPASRRPQAWRCIARGPHALPALRAQTHGPVHRHETQHSALRLRARMARQWRAALHRLRWLAGR